MGVRPLAGPHAVTRAPTAAAAISRRSEGRITISPDEPRSVSPGHFQTLPPLLRGHDPALPEENEVFMGGGATGERLW